MKEIILEELALNWNFNKRKDGDVQVAEKIIKRIKEKLLSDLNKFGLSEANIVEEYINNL